MSPDAAAEAGTILLCFVTIAAGAGMAIAGVTKFISSDMWTEMFTRGGPAPESALDAGRHGLRN